MESGVVVLLRKEDQNKQAKGHINKMKCDWDVVMGSLVLEELLEEGLINKDHYNHMWEIFKDKQDDVNWVLLDMSEVLLNLEQDDCNNIITYLTKECNLKSFTEAKIAI